MDPKHSDNIIDITAYQKRKESERPTSSLLIGFAKKLESKLHTLEQDLKLGLAIMDQELAKSVQNLSKSSVTKDLDGDLNQLSNLLKQRIKSSIETTLKDVHSAADKDELTYIKSLMEQLAKLLSLDFYQGLLKRLREEQDHDEVDEFGMDPQFVQRIKPFFDFLYYKYWRVETTGLHHIPDDGRVLIVGNHSGTLPYDGSMIATALHNEHKTRKDARFLVEDFVYHMPFLGTFMHRTGGVRACPENAERLLSEGHAVIVFPEGVKGIGKLYQKRYQLMRFGRGGFIKLCLKTKTPLVPVGIVGAEEIHPILYKSNVLAKTLGVPYIPITPTFPLMGLLGMIPLPSKWKIRFEKPITFDTYPAKALKQEILIHELSEKVRSRIQRILNKLLKERSSVWLG